MISELLLTGAVVIVLVFLSIIKTAYESLSELSLRVMMADSERSKRARFFRELLESRLQFELTLVLGTQLSITLIAILLTSIFEQTPWRWPLLTAFAATLIIILIFRQLVPRLIVQNRPERALLLALPPFLLFYRAFSLFSGPLSAILSKVKSSEPEPWTGEEEHDDQDTTQEVQALIDVAAEEGIIEEEEGELIQSVIEFGDTLVGEVMRPRPHIVAIPSTATMEDARRLIIDAKYSRIPVYGDSIDEIEGIVYVRDLLTYCEPGREHSPVTECMRPVHSVPDTKPIAQLLEEMQRSKVQMAIVINEYGGVAGLVTVEDIIEEVMGEIEDEDRGHIDKPIEQQADGSYELDGSTEIRVVEELFDKEVEADDFTTIAGLLISMLNRVPAVGEKVEVKGIQFEVLEADSKRVTRVRLRAVKPRAEIESQTATD